MRWIKIVAWPPAMRGQAVKGSVLIRRVVPHIVQKLSMLGQPPESILNFSKRSLIVRLAAPRLDLHHARKILTKQFANQDISMDIYLAFGILFPFRLHLLPVLTLLSLGEHCFESIVILVYFQHLQLLVGKSEWVFL